MVREALQDVFRYRPRFNGDVNFRHPVHYGFHDLFLQGPEAPESLTDEVYVVVFTSALGLSALQLCAARYWSNDPIFPKETLKLPRFRCQDYESVPSHRENGHDISHTKARNTALEPLEGWRLRMGVLQGIILLALVAIHAVILVSDGPTSLRIVFVVYWVRAVIAMMLITGRYICIQLVSFPSDIVS